MYNFKNIEKKWAKYWEENKTFKTDIWDFSKPKYYVLDMFPYPSGVALHCGHVEGYTATDIVARMKRMQGYNVLHPMGFDAFGLPAEQYAIKTGNHPASFTYKNIDTFKKQLYLMGLSYDWDREISTCDPKFYHWTQWIFKNLFTDKLAYLKDMPVNWCEELGTVLANDEVINGKSERGGYPVVRKNMKQWVIDIPKYADKLLEGLNDLDWPDSTKEIQRNWIGKSEGAIIEFTIENSDKKISVFTTRPDTIFGVTYCVLAPEHTLVKEITSKEKLEEVLKYKENCERKSDLERTELNKEKTGVFTGAYAINPLTNKKVPIWISDYVLVGYGTGAIMAVPAHDERDYEFAKKYNLEIIPIIEGGNIDKEAYIGSGNYINSPLLEGINKNEEAIEKTIQYLEKNKLGHRQISYKIRDWIFARQRYWGEPIPIVYDENMTPYALDDDDLPLILPELDDYTPSKTGASPLQKKTDWINTTYHGKKVTRESSTMPGSAGSSWYFLRYIDPQNDKEIGNPELLKHWMPVDLYVGGPEHAVGHLLYSRMWNRYLYEKNIAPTEEPFQKLVHQGMILGENGIKMGKRYPKYSINPNDIIEKYGADTLRVYEMFMGPIEADKPWNNNGVESAQKFLDRIWRLYNSDKIVEQGNPNLDFIFNKTVKKVTDDYESLNFNTAISQMMIFINEVYKEECFPHKYAEDFIKLLNPVAPFISEEIWQLLGHKETIAYESWPTYDESKLVETEKTIAVQVNGKVRATITINVNDSEEVVKEKALEQDNVKRFTEGKEIVKIIVIKGKIVNIVVK